MVPPSKEDLEKLRHIVQSALGIQDGVDPGRKDEITLEEMPFNDESATQLVQDLRKDSQRLLWWEIIKNALYASLALGVVLFFWRLFSRTTLEELPIGVPVGELVAAN